LEHVVLNGSDLEAVNSFAEPEKVKPGKLKISGDKANQLPVILPKLSWNMLRFKIQK